MVEWTIQDACGEVRKIRVEAYYVPEAKIRLFSPQQYFRYHSGGNLFADHRRTLLTLCDGAQLEFPYQQGNGLPLMLTKDYLSSTSHVAGLSFEECQYLATTYELPSIVDTTNQNMNRHQKELLLWHWKLGHAHMGWIQSLAAVPEQRGDNVGMRPIIQTKANSQMSSCERPLCTACELSKATRRTREGARQCTGGCEAAIRSSSLQPGDQVLIDQYQSSFPGRLPHTKGKEKKKDQYTGGTIFVDHASGLVSISHQVSLKVGETLRSKRKFEQQAKQFGVKIKSYRADNVPFGLDEFKNDIAENEQTIDYSGVGAHHQNGVAERAIGTITRFARTMMLQQAMLWPDQADLKLWPFAMDHAVYLWNNLPNKHSKLSPMELFSQVKSSHHFGLLRSHVWGCPVYVLDPKLQDGHKLPKWDPRARRGMYLGVSPEHSSQSISRVLNLRTGAVSPQFHMVYDDKFTTINNPEGAGLIDPSRFDAETWEQLLETGYEMSLDPLEKKLPELDDSWLTPNERCIRLE